MRFRSWLTRCRNWLAAKRKTEDEVLQSGNIGHACLFQASQGYPNVDVSGAGRFFTAPLLKLIAKSDDKQGGVLPMTSVREATRVATNRDPSFLEVVYSRRSVRANSRLSRFRTKISMRAVPIAQLRRPRSATDRPRESASFRGMPIFIKAAVDLQRGFRLPFFRCPPEAPLRSPVSFDVFFCRPMNVIRVTSSRWSVHDVAIVGHGATGGTLVRAVSILP